MQLRPVPRNFKNKTERWSHAQTNFWKMAFRFKFSALSWWQCSISKLFSLGWPIVALEYVFSRRNAEKLRSAVADVAGTTSINLVKRQTWSRSVSLMRDSFQGMPLLCPRCLAISQSGAVRAPSCLMVRAPLASTICYVEKYWVTRVARIVVCR